MPDDGLLSAWILSVLVIDAVCLLIDAADVARCLRGERSPIV